MNDLNEEKCEKKDERANAQMFSSFVFTAESLEAAYAEASSRLLQEVETRKQKKLDAVVRPKIPFWRWLLGLFLPLALDAVAVFTVIELSWNGWLILPAILLITFAFVKPSVILAVLIYQKIAPKRLRCSCRFEPTCSAYMLLAIEKYGFFRGFAKGVNRLSRCRPPNGGVDYP